MSAQPFIIDLTADDEEPVQLQELVTFKHSSLGSTEHQKVFKEKVEKKKVQKQKIIKEKIEKQKVEKKKVEKEVPSCDICTEPINKTTHKIITCPMAACSHEACLSCNKIYLLGSIHQPHCMKCRTEWKSEFLNEHFPASFLKDDYRSMREKILFEEEKTYLPQYQEEAERQLKVDAINQRIQELYGERHRNYDKEDQLVSTQREIERVIAKELTKQQTDLYKWESKKIRIENKDIVMKCPMGDCRGFLNKDYTCGICAINICKHCSKEVSDGHECNPDDVATVEELKRSTKSCPKCHVPIFKTDGCDQMFCTKCHTAFSWRTGVVETGIVHNPEYFRELREGRINDPRHQEVQGACGQLTPFRSILRMIQRGATEEQQIYIQHIYQQCVHHRQVTMNNLLVREDRTMDRIAYLKGELDEKKFKQRLYVCHQKEKRMVEERQIIEMYVILSEELFRNMREDTIMDFLQQYNTVRKLTYDAILSLDKKYQHKGVVSPYDIIPK